MELCREEPCPCIICMEAVFSLLSLVLAGVGYHGYHVPTSYKRTQNCVVLCIMIVRKHQAEVRLLLILKSL